VSNIGEVCFVVWCGLCFCSKVRCGLTVHQKIVAPVSILVKPVFVLGVVCALVQRFSRDDILVQT
jgi:hypothetical protein